ncbi:MAG: DUF4348 domain-containing protein, partial [Bacteroides sp.]|nr:DUF4348 domain-containing protein [Bacteroides sp.]
FIDNYYYTLLFDNEEELDRIESDSLTSVQVEWFYLADRRVKRYYFEKINDIWKLEALNLRDIEDTGHEDFITFLRQFAADSLFQAQHIRIPLQFAMLDPDDEFSLLESTIDLEQWYAFKPELPVDRLFNISYGQHNEDDSRTKILTFKGNNNRLSVHLYFRRHHGMWELYKFEDSTT